MKTEIRPKSRCCKESPRCKRCPVVCKRLVSAGLATRSSCGVVVLLATTTKKDVKRARKRKHRVLTPA